MAYQATVLNVLIASPGDVGAERLAIRSIIYDWNAVHSRDRRVVLLPVAWETSASPAIGERAQAVINNQLVADADMLVGVFWTRLGTPTGAAASGTVEEIDQLIAAGKPVMLYQSRAPLAPDSFDREQYEQLRDVLEGYQRSGLVFEYASLDEFRDLFHRQLPMTIIRSFEAESMPGTTPAHAGALTSEDREWLVGLSEQAKTLLKATSQDPNGTLLVIDAMGGLSVETNGKDFLPDKSGRAEAAARRAVRDLESRGWLEQRDSRGEVFSMTDEGYRFAELLSALHPDA